MNIGDPIFKDNKQVGKISYLTNESLFVKFNETEEVQRFHKMVFKGYLKSKGNLSDYDKITTYTIKL